MAIYVCVPCATGACADCVGRVVRGRVTKRCACRHDTTPRLARTADPRALPGAIVGPGGPRDEGAVLIDTRHAVLVDHSTVAVVDNPSDGRHLMAVLLEGKINRTEDRSAVLHLINGDGAAALVSQIVGLAARIGPAFEAEFRASLDARMAAEDLWPAVVPAGPADGSQPGGP